MKAMLFISAVLGWTTVSAAGPVFESLDENFSVGFTQIMNGNVAQIADEVGKHDNKCVSLQKGRCVGFSERVMFSRDGKFHTSFSGFCTVGGDNCDINTDSSWQVMVQGYDDIFTFVKVVKVFEEI